MKILIDWCHTQFSNYGKVFRIASFEKKAAHQSHFLGLFWEFLSPTIQIVIYYLIFGMRLGGRQMMESGVPYIFWMFIGVIPWFYMSASINTGVNSISSNLNLISKTKFPVEILPTMSVVRGLNGFFTMMGLFLCLYIGTGHFPDVYWVQLIYYFFAMILLMVALATLNSVISLIFRDYQLIVSSTMRLLFFVSGAVINISTHPESLMTKLFMLNPIVYIVEGFRDALLSRAWMFDHIWWSIYFFGVTLLILLAGVYMTNKYKNYFVEYS
ncbi:ABC transporter permease [Listeria booriae]|uniref:ABC transporter permease n=1 Tax=Listeria booriae TaxID=1552123 RepID=UPI0016294368|nr:ABC transporter permease [Listeria booriae]MBC1233432.1 ABC transporter permease [Listeria booriae]MBC1245750.1 ABC transporter permease [Listeria booriae]